MSGTTPEQRAIDAGNAAFWNELCGSQAARAIGVTGNDSASLAKFDQFFFDFYPYVDRFIPFQSLNGRDVLEVGLGYGSVSQRLAEHGARLTALDIAHAPAAGVAHRLDQSNLTGRAIQGSILSAPFPSGSFDYVVSIGCFHHTGNLPLALAETARLLRPGGRATIMTYSATSYWRWYTDPVRTGRYAWAALTGDPPPLNVDAIYDRNLAGDPAPETVLLSKTHFNRLLGRHFSRVQIARANAVAPGFLRRVPRRVWLTLLGRPAGMDLYAMVTK